MLDLELLRATERAARRSKLNRSALIREALRQHLKKLKIGELEKSDRRGYQSTSEDANELLRWESEAVWPAD